MLHNWSFKIGSQDFQVNHSLNDYIYSFLFLFFAHLNNKSTSYHINPLHKSNTQPHTSNCEENLHYCSQNQNAQVFAQ